jgi:DNA-directed RNA polymerase specialized sigma24 family protein
MSELSEKTWESLLGVLDPNPDRAGEKYEHIRRALLRFFRNRQCLHPEELTDETIDRAARRISEGVSIETANIANYFLGIARFVVKESWKGRPSDSALEDLRPDQQPRVDPKAIQRGELEREDTETGTRCLTECIEQCFPHNRDLLVKYYASERREKIDARSAMCRELGITLNTLRIRMCRMRQKLESCVRECVAA